MARPQAPVGAPKTPAPNQEYRARLLAVRDLLEARLPLAGDRELPGLVSRYESVLEKLAALPEAVEVDDLDDLTAARRRRRAGASAS